MLGKCLACLPEILVRKACIAKGVELGLNLAYDESSTLFLAVVDSANNDFCSAAALSV